MSDAHPDSLRAQVELCQRSWRALHPRVPIIFGFGASSVTARLVLEGGPVVSAKQLAALLQDALTFERLLTAYLQAPPASWRHAS
jgi:hypothetical protein